MRYLILLIASVVGAIFYRMGGAGEQWGKNNKLWRRLGVPVIATLYLSFFCLHGVIDLRTIISLFVTLGLLVGANSSYWTFHDTDATAINWILVGALNGLALAPFVWATHLYTPFIVRTLVTTFLIAFWSLRVDNAVREELGRGFIIIATLGVFA